MRNLHNIISRESIQYLFSLHRFGIKPGLERIKTILKELNNPQKQLKAIHIAGTNGKGSVAAMISSIISHAGFKVGLYTSPHLLDFRERIRINDRMISPGEVINMIHEIRNAWDKARKRNKITENFTFFEASTAMALKYFAQKHVDFAVIEVGLGGSWDATNVIEPVLSIITDIDYDHKEFLGNSLKEIAVDKSGIIKKKSIVLSGVRRATASWIVRERSRKLKALLFEADKCINTRVNKLSLEGTYFDAYIYNNSYINLKLPLLGEYQVRNASIALMAAWLLSISYPAIDEVAIRAGLEKVQWRGRFQIIQSNPCVVLDGAHNPGGCRELIRALKLYFQGKRILLILGISRDKDVKKMLKILCPGVNDLVLTKSSNQRAINPVEMKELIPDFMGNVHITDDVIEGLRVAKNIAKADDVICVTGSLFTVADALVAFAKKSLKLLQK